MEQEIGQQVGATRRPWAVLVATAVAVLIGGAVLASATGGLWQRSAAEDPQFVACDLYPIAVPQSLLANAQPGQVFAQMPRGTGAGNYSWLSWTGDPSAPALTGSLAVPGNAHTYTDPDDATDTRVDIGDWTQGAPGSMNARSVRDNLDALLNQDIVVPAYDATRGEGNRFDYRVARFAVIRLRDYQLTGQGWLSFEFRGFKRCYNTPPVAQDQRLTTPEDTSLAITLTATDPQPEDALTYTVLDQPQHGSLSGSAPNLVYTPVPNYNGPDRFIFRANDGIFDSQPATVFIDVTPVNDPPRITSTPVLDAADGKPYSYQATAEDIDLGDVLTFSLTNPPVGMQIDPQTGLIGWVPTLEQVGTHEIVVVVTDAAGASDTQTYSLTVVRSNRPPEIVSTPVLEALDSTLYTYPVAAVDNDPGDIVSYSLALAPAGMGIDAATGLIAWTPTVEQVGSHAVTVVATDRAGATDTQTFTVVVARSNRPPSIVSAPVQDAPEDAGYLYNVQATDPDVGDVLNFSLQHSPTGMVIAAATGALTWPTASWQAAGWAGNNRLPNTMCLAGGEQLASLAPAADVVVVVDESGSMSGEHAWLGDFAAPLEAHLASNGVGAGTVPNRYGLIGYEAAPRPISMPAGAMDNYREFIKATDRLSIYGGTEDGWRAIRHALFQYPLRNDVARNIILVTDEDRDNADSALSYASVLADLRAQKAVLNAVVNARFRCGDGSSALGMGQNRVGYKADGRGGFVTCANVTATSGDGTTLQNYVDLALATGGAAWDIEVLRDGGLVAQSFTNALLKIKVQEILQQLPTRNLPDVYVHGLQAYRGTIQVDVGNRGLASVGDAIAVQVFADDVLIDVLPLADLPAGALERLSLPWPMLGGEPQRLSARLVVPSAVAECKLDNNTLDAAWVRVRATDRGGLYDEQSFSVQPLDDNDAPSIVSTPVVVTGVGRRYGYAVSATDPDRGDALAFELVAAPIGMVVNRITGEVNWIPDAAQQGTHTVDIRVRDLAGATARQSFQITVDAAQLPPRFVSLPERRAIQGTTYLYAPQVQADASAQLAFDAFTAPAGFQMDPASGAIQWQVPANFAGKNERIVLRVRDQFGNYDLQVYTLLGDLPNQAPRIVSSPGLSATVGNGYGYSPTVSDVNVLENFRWRGDTLPAGATVNATSGALSWPAGSVQSTLPAAMAAANPYCFAQDAAVTPFAPRQLWANTRVRYLGQTLVGPLADTDFDGELTSRDLTAVVGISQTDTTVGNRRIHAFNARNGQTLWSYNQRTPEWTVQPAMADLEGNGSSTILFVDSQRHLVALRSDGTQRWISAAPVAPSTLNYNAIVVSDLEGDGVAEILIGPAVFTNVGTLKWQFTANASYNQGTPAVLDLDGDGRREVLFRGEVRDANGVLRTRLPSARDSTVYFAFYAPVSLAGSSRPHVAISEYTSAGYRLSLVDASGNALWVRGSLGGASPLLVSDFDGDGVQDIYAGAINRLYSAQGNVLWTSAGNGGNANFRAAIAGDLDRDGELDILTLNNATASLNLIAGRTGAVIGRLGMSLDFGAQVPALVDLDGDGNTMLLIGDSAALRAYRSSGAPWPTAARVVHQQPFALDQIRSDLRLSPVDPNAAPASSFVFGQRQNPATATAFFSDLRTSAPYGLENASGALTLSADVSNRGTANSLPAEVAFYAGGIDGQLLGRVAVAALQPGQSVRADLASNRTAVGQGEVTAVVLPAAGERECATANNAASGRSFRITVSDYGNLEGSQFWVAAVNERMLAPSFITTAPNRVVERQLYRYAAAATTPHAGDVVTYSLSNAPDGASVDPRSGEILWTPRWGQIGNFSFSLVARSLNGLTIIQSWTVTVTASTEPNLLPSIVSTPVTAATVNQAYRYDVRATDPEGQAIVYALAAAPTGMQVNAETGTILWIPNTVPATPVAVRVSATDERGGRVEQSFSIRVYATPNRPPSIASTPQRVVQLGDSFAYTPTASDPDGDPLTTLWTTVPAGASVTGGNVTWTPTAAQLGEHAFVVEVRDDRGGMVRQSFTVFVIDPAGNTAPQIVSAPNPRAAVGSGYVYNVVADDAEGDTLAYSLTERPQGMTIDAVTGAVRWTPIATQLGVHTVQVQVSDGRGGVAWQRYSVEVSEQGSGTGNSAPEILTSPAFSAKAGFAYRYDVRARDLDGDLLAFSLSDAPAGMTIDGTTGRIDYLPAQAGSAPVRVRVSDGTLWTEQSWTLSIADGTPLSASIELPGGAQVLPGEEVQVRIVPANAASQVTAVLTLDGVPVPLDADLSAVVSTTVLGRHMLTVTVSDGYETTTGSTEFFVLDPNSSEGPTVSIAAPLEGAVVTAPVAVTGAIADADLVGWSLTAIDRNGTSSTTLATGTAATSGTLGTFDPSLLLNGQYVIVLRAWDALGHESRAFSNVVVDGEMKLGHFSVSFEDANIPVMGIPITVTRTYDSRRSNRSLDFGHGWSVDFQNVRIHESRTIGNGWSLQEERSGFFSNWCVRPNGDPVVTVTLPDGDVQRFRARAMPECQFLIPAVDVQLVFEALPGTYSKLEQTSYGTLRLNGGVLLDLGEIEVADPDYYRLTTKEGMRYDIDQSFGIRKVTDLNGNALTYTRDGVAHSSGVGVQFLRDSQGRISTIRLPDGNFIDYDYDASGDLVAMVDPVGNISRYGYLQGRYAHYLQDIVDARGIRVARNEYDDDGRLVAHIDASGNRIEYDIDVQGRTQTVRDRLGNQTVYVFDGEGRVLSETNALGETTQRTYDSFGNETSRLNAEGELWRWSWDGAGNKISETDPLGRITRWTYDNRGQVLTQTDPAGVVTVNNVYSSSTGNLTAVTDANGQRTDFAYSTGGDMTEWRQPLGRITRFVYDNRGNKTRQTTPDGAVTEYLYDANGKLTAEIRYRADENGTQRVMTTRYGYDAAGRRVSVTDPLGNIARVEYNAIGKESARIDPLGRRTEMRYDARGNLSEVLYPDGTRETQLYDAEDRLRSRTDRGGRTTTMVYDTAGRLIQTTFPDGATEKRVYDRAGREISREDARGYLTRFAHDDAGRLVSTTDPLGQITTITYNPNGTKASERDALGRTTKFVYDPARRLIETIHPDATTSDADNPRSRISYDALGRIVSKTDEMGRVTAYEYAANDELAAVIDAAGQRTEYQYDAVGNRIAQRDALGRTTRWVYDDGGREVARILPMGQRETKRYDSNGNLTDHVDFNGAATLRRYDVNDRIVETRHADGTATLTAYTPTGQVASQTDAAGTTQYVHDVRDRLLTVLHPDGVRIDYAYDAVGNRVRMTTSQQDVTYAYDAMSRLTTATLGTQVTRYTYDAVGNRAVVTLPNGNRSEYAYDLRNRLRTLFHRSATSVILLGLTYTTDSSGLQTQLVEQGAGLTRTVSYQYDTLKRLTREQVIDGTRGNRTSVWTYDAVGNRLTQSRTKGGTTRTTTYAYDDNDRLLSESASDGGSVTYRYDANGNLVEKTEAAGRSVYSYDGARRLVDAITPAAALSYRYDASGIRQSQTINGQTTRFVVDPTAEYDQVIEERSAGGVVAYLTGEDRIARSEAGQVNYLHGDAIGSARLMTAASGAAGDRWWFEAFGETESQTGSSAHPFLFAGEQYDRQLGLYYLRARYMDPQIGRFTQMDLWPGKPCEPQSLHDYGYAHGNPVNYVDPSGQFIGLAGGFVNISFAQFQTVYLRQRDANRAYQTYNRLVGTLCRSVDKISDRLHGHHARPKYLGGPVDQDLAMVSETIHRQLHSMLSIITRLNGYKIKKFDDFDALSPAGQADVLEILKQTTKAVDAACLGVPNYDPIYPKLEKYL